MRLNRLTLNELLKYGLSHYGSLPFAGYVDEDSYTFREYESAVGRLFQTSGNKIAERAF